MSPYDFLAISGLPILLILAVLWLARKLLLTRLIKSVEHEFNRKLETLRSDLRNNEEEYRADIQSRINEIVAIQSGVMSSITSRQNTLTQRRFEAIDQVWDSLYVHKSLYGLSAILAHIDFDKSVKLVVSDTKMRDFFSSLEAQFKVNLDKAAQRNSQKEQLYVSSRAWVLFSAYRAIIMRVYIEITLLKTGTGKERLDMAAVSGLVKAALPHQAEYIDKYGEKGGYHWLLDEIERQLLVELKAMMTEVKAEVVNIEQASELFKYANEVASSHNEFLSDLPDDITTDIPRP